MQVTEQTESGGESENGAALHCENEGQCTDNCRGGDIEIFLYHVAATESITYIADGSKRNS